MKPQFHIFIFTTIYLSTLTTAINIRHAKVDPLFSYKKPIQRDLTQHKNTQPDLQYTPPKPQKRELLLDWFDNDKKDEEVKVTGKTSDDMTRLMQMLKLAHSFDKDPNYEVQLDINFSNGGGEQNGRRLQDARKLSEKSNNEIFSL